MKGELSVTSEIPAFEDLEKLLSEILGRVDRFQRPMFSVTGVQDLIDLSMKVEKLQAEHSLPRMLELRSLPNRDIISFKVWDPHLPGSSGVIGFLTQGAEFCSTVNGTNLPVVIDYLGRHKRYLSEEMRKLQSILTRETNNTTDSMWDHARYLVQLFLGDVRFRVPKLLITLGAGAVLPQWWLPLIHALAVKYLEIPEKKLIPVESASQTIGVVLLVLGIGLWVWIARREGRPNGSSPERQNGSENHDGCRSSSPDQKLGTFKIIPEGRASLPVGEAQTPQEAIGLAKAMAERHATSYHIYLMNSNGAFIQDLGTVHPPDWPSGSDEH